MDASFAKKGNDHADNHQSRAGDTMRTVHHLDGTDTYLYRVRVTFYRDNPDVPAGVTKIIAEGEIEMRSLKNEAAVKDEAVRYMTLHTGGQWTDGNITAITAEII